MGEAGEEVHEFFANFTLVLVGAHVLGVVLASRLHGENLVAAMWHGRKASDRT
jgi:cytochrome b